MTSSGRRASLNIIMLARLSCTLITAAWLLTVMATWRCWNWRRRSIYPVRMCAPSPWQTRGKRSWTTWTVGLPAGARWMWGESCQLCCRYDLQSGDILSVLLIYMMTSSIGNIFRVTGPLCGEFPPQRPVTRSFDVVFFICALNKQVSKQS